MTDSNWIPNLVKDRAPAVGAVSIWAEGNLLGRGSAFAVHPLPGDAIDPSTDSVLVTNAHVVAHPDHDPEVRVRFSGGFDYRAQVRLVDKETDIAILQVPVACEDPFDLRLSAQVDVGESVVAIGNPLGFECSVSAGIVSGTNRVFTDMGSDYVYANLLQTDTPINPGNSGGPLIGRDGAVIGVNSLGFPSADGVNFAVPTDTVLSHYNELVNFGEGAVRRASLGATVASYHFEPEQQHAFGILSGAEIRSVREGGPLESAGLQVGDIVIGFDGEKIEHRPALMLMLKRETIGAEKNIRFVREQEVMEATITPSERSK